MRGVVFGQHPPIVNELEEDHTSSWVSGFGLGGLTLRFSWDL